MRPAMNDVERMIWASAYAAAVYDHQPVLTAIGMAWDAVYQLRTAHADVAQVFGSAEVAPVTAAYVEALAGPPVKLPPPLPKMSRKLAPKSRRKKT